jgi:hypothetical protein
MPTNPTNGGAQRPPDTHLRSVVRVTDALKRHQGESWAWAEVACSNEPAVALYVPLDRDGWIFVDLDTAVALGAALIRIAGAARASHYYEPPDGTGPS